MVRWVCAVHVFDHKNIERAESVLSSRSASKKLVNWIADTQHILFTVVRVWIEGKTNALADAGSRAAWLSEVVRHLPVPDKPIRDTVRLLFTSPEEIRQHVSQRRTDMGEQPWIGAGSADVPIERQLMEFDSTGEDSVVYRAESTRSAPMVALQAEDSLLISCWNWRISLILALRFEKARRSL